MGINMWSCEHHHHEGGGGNAGGGPLIVEIYLDPDEYEKGYRFRDYTTEEPLSIAYVQELYAKGENIIFHDNEKRYYPVYAETIDSLFCLYQQDTGHKFVIYNEYRIDVYAETIEFYTASIPHNGMQKG